MHEWPLLIFTFLLQAAIGGTLALFYLQGKMEKEMERGQVYLALKPSAITLVTLSIVGLIASFFHLGTPTHAFNLIRHLGSSWMSREILFSGLFIFLLLVTLFLALKTKGFSRPLLLISGLVGSIAVWTMAASYADTIHSAWNHAYTYIAFYANTFTIGALLIDCLLFAQQKKVAVNDKIKGALHRLSFFAVTVLLIQIVAAPSYYASLSVGDEAEVASIMLMATSYAGMILFQWVLLFLGGLGVILVLWKADKLQASQLQSILYLALVVLIIGEFVARYLFYATGLPLGVGL